MRSASHRELCVRTRDLGSYSRLATQPVDAFTVTERSRSLGRLRCSEWQRGAAGCAAGGRQPRMPDRVIVPLPGLGHLVLDAETYRAALHEGTTVIPTGVASQGHAADLSLLDSEQLAAALGVPATWIEQAARENRIPSLRIGRRRRFCRAEVEAAVRLNRTRAP